MHINRRYKRVKCPQCEKHFLKQADCDNHFRDVHKFACSISGCSVFKYNKIELHEHLRYNHRSKMVFRCNKCVKVFSTRLELHQHHKVDHGRVKLADAQGEKYPWLRCKREFLSESMFVSHSRDHKENVYGCNEWLWLMNDLCTHTKSHHIKLCHLCHRIFVSDDKLFAHIHPGSTVCT